MKTVAFHLQKTLYRIETNDGPGAGVKIRNKPIPLAFRESVSYAEQTLYARARQLVGDRDPRKHELNVQLRAFDAARSGAWLDVAGSPVQFAAQEVRARRDDRRRRNQPRPVDRTDPLPSHPDGDRRGEGRQRQLFDILFG